MIEKEENNIDIKIDWATSEDAGQILALIGRAPDALVQVTEVEILTWIEKGQSLVAKDVNGNILGHQGMSYWEGIGLVELRSAFVDPEARGQGLNTKMKEVMIDEAKNKYPDCTLVGFTEAASKSRGILGKMGFKEIPLTDVPDDLFSICPASCFKKTGEDCGCKVFYYITNGKK